MPFTTSTPSPHRAVGIDALVVQTPGPAPTSKLGALTLEGVGPQASWQATASSVAATPRRGARPFQLWRSISCRPRRGEACVRWLPENRHSGGIPHLYGG